MKMKNVLAAVLCISSTVLAYSGGSGTSGNPYQIANVADFQQLSATPTHWNLYFILTANIDLTGLTFTQSPIAPDTNNTTSGFQGTQFTGVLNGNGHFISNLTISASTKDYVSLFGAVSGTIKNLGMENVDITGRDCVGGLAGWNAYGALTSCYATGSITGNHHAGGLVGWNSRSNSGGTITSCYATGSVGGYYDNGVGGLVGRNQGDSVYVGAAINRCYAASTSYVSLVGWSIAWLIDEQTGQQTQLVPDSYLIVNSFWDTQTSGITTNPSGGGTGKTTAEMQTLSTFTSAGWDFPTTWQMPANDYPRLAWETYVPVVATPAFSPDGGVYSGVGPNVTITCITAGATIHYTTTGLDPTESDPVIASGSSVEVSIIPETTLKARAFKAGWTPSGVKAATYTISIVATPIFSPDGGVYSGGQNVTITCEATATVHYTTNGLDPTESDSVIASGASVAVSVDPATTLKARAFRVGSMPSGVKTATYSQVVSTPTFSPDGGVYSSGQNVTITCITAGATIHYTTNGLDPTESDLIIASGTSMAVSVNPTTTLKARAFKVGSIQSGVKAATYIFQPSYGGGAGTAANPYQITNVADFQQLSARPTDWSKAFVLTADIDLTGLTFTQSPIAPDTNSVADGFQGTAFTGIFDGNSHTISRLTITESAQFSVGLFGYVESGSQIRNLGVENVNISGTGSYVGGLAGYNYGTLTSCYMTGLVSGGVVGGLVGQNRGSLTGCYATGSVSGGKGGGLVGLNNNGSTITACYATGSVNGTYAGGLVQANYGTISGSYATGPISGAGVWNSTAGGLAESNTGTINGCYATGLVVNEGGSVSGLVGGVNAGTITSCFWDTQTSSQTYSAGGTGKTTAEMKTLSTFTNAGWDFTISDGDPADWQLPANSYPHLAWEKLSLLLISSWPGSLTVEQGVTSTFTFDLSRQTAGSAVSWTVSADAACPWISSITPASGSSVSPADSTTITVSIDASALDVGIYTTVLSISDGTVTLQKAVSTTVVNHVNIEEFSILASYWGMTGCTAVLPCSDADWFTDGTIDIRDLQQLCISWLGEEMIYGSPEIKDGYETGNFSALSWALSGNANWTVVSTGAYEGTYAAKSGTITHSQSSNLEFAVNTGDATTISFVRKVSSEASFDYLRFYIDGVEKNKWSGTADWAIQTFTLTPGQHTFKWSYTKDGSVSSGSDCAWIDNVRIFKP